MGIENSLPKGSSPLATVSLRTWQDCQGEDPNVPSVVATITQDRNYDGIEIVIGSMEVYIEHDADLGLVVRVWRDRASGDDACIEQSFELKDILPGQQS